MTTFMSKAMKSILLSAVILSSVQAVTSEAVKSGLVKVSTDRSVYYESQILDPEQKTLVLMPGIYRGLSFQTQDSLLKDLTAQKINWVSFHFSGHPQSIIASQAHNKNLNPLSLKDLADEARAVVKQLRIKKPVMTTLSYSSAAASDFSSKEFSKIIETAPIGSQDEENNSMKPWIDATNFWCGLNPFCNPIWEAEKVAAYKKHWEPEVERMSSSYPELVNAPYKELSIDGYVGMARAVESYELTKQDLSKGPQRIFILGEKEEKNRSKMQAEAIKKLAAQNGQYPLVFIVEGAGHIVPFDQPESYMKVLELILNETIPTTSRVFLIKTDGELKALTIAEIEHIFAN